MSKRGMICKETILEVKKCLDKMDFFQKSSWVKLCKRNWNKE